MYSTLTLLAACFAAVSSAAPSSVEKRQSSCPSVWSSIATDLQSTFVSDSTCTDSARQAIRLTFHDCFPGSCDGSVILANECDDRIENTQMTPICSTLASKASSFNVSTADLIQFAGAIGMASCSGGPVTSFYIGRNDSSTANAENQMPGPNTNATTLTSMFEAKGFTIAEMVALSGAHTIGKLLNDSSMDTTPNKWDASFYTDVSSGKAVNAIGADISMSSDSTTKDDWANMGTSDTTFAATFVPAMEKMSLMGVDKSALTDCSDVVTNYAAGSLRRRMLMRHQRMR